MKKIYTYLVFSAFVLLGLKANAQVDVCMSISGDRMYFYYTSEVDYNMLPNNLWNSQVLTVRYPNSVTVNWADLQNNTAFNYIEDPSTIPATDGGDGFLYKKFSSNTLASMLDLLTGNQTEIFSIQISSVNVVTFEMITGNAWTSNLANNGNAAINNAILGNQFDEFTTSCGTQTFNANCQPPINLAVLSTTETEATLQWETQNSPPIDHCWTIEVGASGFDCGQGEQVVEITVCEGDPGVTVVGDVVTYTVSGLQPGTQYQYTLVETCDGLGPNNSGNCANAVSPPFATFDSPFVIASANIVSPTCPFVSPGYIADGSFEINITDGVSCPGSTYDITVTPIAGSGPLGSTPPAVTPSFVLGATEIGSPYGFANAGAGQYNVSVLETGPCNQMVNPEVINVVVPDGTDTDDPVWQITDILGNVLADNDPLTPQGTTADLGNMTIPEGECGFQQQLYASGIDGCDGFIVAPDAVSTVSINTVPATINPATQTTHSDDGFGNYLIDIFWSTGTTTAVFQMADAAGNTPDLTIINTVNDNVNPTIDAAAAEYLIPVCGLETTPVYGFTVSDGCDQNIDQANLSTITISGFPGATVDFFFGPQNGYFEYSLTGLTEGTGFLTIAYTDDFGNTTTVQPQITVTEAAEDLDPVIDVPGNLSYHIPACLDDDLLILSIQVWDDCADIVQGGLVFNDDGSGIGDNLFFSADADNNTGYWEFSGFVEPGTYLMSATYTNPGNGQSTFLDFLVDVTQDAPQPADIVMPGNLNFTIPVCENELTTTFNIQILDECDEVINPGNAFFRLGGEPITGTFVNDGYFEFTETLTADNDGDLLEASYTDGNGIVTTVDALITVTDQPDNWAPIVVYPSNDINVELDPCESGPAIIFFEVTATDNCDGDLTPDVTIAPPADGLLVLPSPGGDTYAVSAFPGTYQVLIEVQDAAGNTRQEDFFIVVTQDPAPLTNLACNDNINVTLNDNCQAELVPDMVLEGNFGCLTDADFTLVVQDGNTANGPIVDGCGDFIYEISVGGGGGNVTGFTGPFAPGNWTVAFGTSASVSFTADQLTLTSGAPGATASDAMVAIPFPFNGNVSFDYYIEQENSIIEDIIIIDINGNLIVDLDDTPGGNPFILQGTVDEAVEAGWVLMFIIDGDGFTTGTVTSLMEITNFAFSGLSADPGDFTQCWGYIHAEDKTPPVIDCPDDTNTALVEEDVQTISGELTMGDPSLPLTDYTCFLEILNAQNFPGEPYFYDLCTFTPSQTDVYTFFLQGPAAGTGPSMGALFQGGFSPNDPCGNIIYQNDQVFGSIPGFFGINPGGNFTTINFNPIVRVSLPLQAGQSYTLLTTSTLPEATGTYEWTIFSDGDGVLNGPCVSAPAAAAFERELICDDLDYILIDNLPANVPRCYRTDRDGNVIFPPSQLERQRLQQLLDVLGYTGYPNADGTFNNGSITDNCGNIEICVEDAVQTNGDCGPAIVTRTFTAKDKQGTYTTTSPCDGAPYVVSCDQIITIRKPNLPTDVIFPPFTSYLECDEGFEVDANGNPTPGITGYPFLQTAFGFEDLDEVYCNLAASYDDTDQIDVCDNTYKLVREWTVVDWCAPGDFRNWTQIIKVGDFTPPGVECPIMDWDGDGLPDGVLTYSTGPFDCTASFAVPAPTITDNCSPTATVVGQIVTTVVEDVLDIYGNPTGQTTSDTVIVATLDPVVIDLANPPSTIGFVSGIPLGCHRFRYTVEDACEKQTVIECDFYVEDQVEPIAVCDDDMNISIGGQGLARVYADDIDEGSSDNCGPIRIEVRRLVTEDPNTCSPIPPFYSPWGDYVDFNCCDVDDMVTIELRVWDDRNGDGIPGNTIPVVLCDGTTELVTDNHNICWLEVLIEDKVNPFCVPPHNEQADCDALPYDFNPTDTLQLQDLFGNAEAQDNCPGAVTRELTPIVNLHDCGFGTIIRRFQARDAVGNVSTNSCQQIITINEVHNYEIKFPRDAEANCGTPSPDTIDYNEIGCDLLAVSVEDEFFSASGDECYKIFRTFRVINWCEYDGEADPIVVGRDEDCDGQPGDEDVWVLVRPNLVTYYDRDNNENNNNPFQFTKSPACDGLTNPAGHWINSNIDQNATPPRDIASVGYWQYTQHIKVYDNIDPIITPGDFDPFCSIDNVDCDGPVDVPFSVDENCTPDDLTIKVFLDAFSDGVIDFSLEVDNEGNVSGDVGVITVSGTYPDYNITGEYPIGAHIFEVHVEDGCGNVGAIDIPFEVVDCKAPTPICINGLAIELMPVEPGTDADGDGDEDTGAMAIWASDFIASPITDCTEPIKYSINRAGETPDINQDGIILTCDDPETLIVEIYAWDSAFNPYAVQPDGTVGGPNYDFCETYVLVQDNMFNLCEPGPGSGSIAGTIQTELNSPVENVNVNLSGQMTNDVLTDQAGYYEFGNLEEGHDYTVTPELDINPLNGVSTFDLVLISKHILGVQPLNTPYKLIAADVNNTQTITTLDLIHARKLILAIEDEFPNNTSWRFVDGAYSFPVPSNPWFEAFPEIVNINDLPANAVENQDFVAVKIGDVNGNAVTSSFLSVEERDVAGTFTFEVADEAIKMGNEHVVNFTADEMASIQGYQATLTFDATALELVDVAYGVAGEENFGMRFVNEGMITMSWNGEASAEDVLFSLVFRGKVDAQLSEVLGVSSRYTFAEAYNTNNENLDVAINFNGKVASAGFELYQNTPNPFKGETLIGFNLPAEATATITIHDVTGKALKLIRGDFAKGYNQVTVNSSELAATGVLYYTVETADYTATKKMIIVE